VKIEPCPAEVVDDLCLLPEQHWGVHSYELSKECVPL
jgi:hypothetical protein